MNEQRNHLVIVLEGVDQAEFERVLADTGWKYGIAPFSAPGYAVQLVENIGEHSRRREAELRSHSASRA